MLKNRSGEAISGGEDRPRKKLSFRDPEVMTPIRTGPLSAPTTKSTTPLPQLSRPHSVAGVVGLGGLSAQSGLPGMSSPTPSSPSSAGVFFKGVATSLGVLSHTVASKGMPLHLVNHSPTRSSSHKAESRPHISQEEIRGQSQKSTISKKEDKSPLAEETVLSSSPTTKRPHIQQIAKAISTKISSRENHSKKNSSRQSTRKQNSDLVPSPNSPTVDRSRKTQQSFPCPSLEDLELEVCSCNKKKPTALNQKGKFWKY